MTETQNSIASYKKCHLASKPVGSFSVCDTFQSQKVTITIRYRQVAKTFSKMWMVFRGVGTGKPFFLLDQITPQLKNTSTRKKQQSSPLSFFYLRFWYTAKHFVYPPLFEDIVLLQKFLVQPVRMGASRNMIGYLRDGVREQCLLNCPSEVS